VCRLAFIPDPNNWTVDSVKELYTELTSSQGGDGIGIGGYRKGQPKLLKGMALPHKVAAEHTVHGGPWDRGTLFHTRLSTHGGDSDYLCHPFHVPRGFLVHNGIWGDYSDWKGPIMDLQRKRNKVKMPDGPSDTYVMAQLYKYYGTKGIKEMVNYGIVLMMSGDNKPKWPVAWCPNGSFQMAATVNGWVYASEIPYEWGMEHGVSYIVEPKRQTLIVMKPTGPQVLDGDVDYKALEDNHFGYRGYYERKYSGHNTRREPHSRRVGFGGAGGTPRGHTSDDTEPLNFQRFRDSISGSQDSAIDWTEDQYEREDRYDDGESEYKF
jgi:hypothetical protein